MYLIYGEDSYLLNKQKDKILKNFTDEIDLEVYNYYETSFLTILASANTPTMFANQKVIVIQDCYFLTEDKHQSKFYDQSVAEALLKYLHNPNLSTTLIFLCPTTNLSKRLKITKEFLTILKVLLVEVPDEKQLLTIVNQFVNQRNSKISIDSANYFLSVVPHNLLVIRNELQKLTLISDDITKDIISNNIGKYYETDIFILVNSLLACDLNLFLNNYYYLLETGVNFATIISLLTNNIVLIRNMLILVSENYNFLYISKKLTVHPYRVKKVSEYLNNFSIIKCNKILTTLTKIDYIFKKGIINNDFPNDALLIKLFKQ